jgi:hypothetical protein
MAVDSQSDGFWISQEELKQQLLRECEEFCWRIKAEYAQGNISKERYDGEMAFYELWIEILKQGGQV